MFILFYSGSYKNKKRSFLSFSRDYNIFASNNILLLISTV